MTDNEIIKALECCTYHHGRCTSCPLYAEVITGCQSTLFDNALDLINRQKAEIERLNEKITAKDENNYYFMGQLRLAREKLLIARSEVIKEVEKRLKEKLQWDVEFDNKFVFESDIDNLVKEMEVETNQRKEDEGK